MKTYKVFGKNKHIPVCVTIKAQSVKDASIEFYLLHGTEISNIYTEGIHFY